MKKIILSVGFMLLAFTTINAQITSLNSLLNESRFVKWKDKVISPDGKSMTYGDIEGNPFLSKMFLSANIQNATSAVPSRYDSYSDTVQLLSGEEVFELPKSEKYPRVTFSTPPMSLIFVNSGSEPAGYFVEIMNGNYKLLKKLKAEYRPAQPAIDSYSPAIPAKFVNLNPVYFILHENQLIKIPKNSKDLPDLIPEKKSEIATFLKSNKIKTNQEVDLFKLTKFLNQ